MKDPLFAAVYYCYEIANRIRLIPSEPSPTSPKREIGESPSVGFEGDSMSKLTSPHLKLIVSDKTLWNQTKENFKSERLSS